MAVKFRFYLTFNGEENISMRKIKKGGKVQVLFDI